MDLKRHINFVNEGRYDEIPFIKTIEKMLYDKLERDGYTHNTANILSEQGILNGWKDIDVTNDNTYLELYFSYDMEIPTLDYMKDLVKDIFPSFKIYNKLYVNKYGSSAMDYLYVFNTEALMNSSLGKSLIGINKFNL